MAITPLRLDGQNLGFQTTGADPISVLSLDVSTGVVTSAYLTALDIQNLKPAVTELFSLVPLANRAANALGLLERLITVASAGSATIVLSTTNVGNVYTLVATPSAAAYLTAHLPFTPDGNIAWAVGLSGAGGGGAALVYNEEIEEPAGSYPSISYTDWFIELGPGVPVPGATITVNGTPYVGVPGVPGPNQFTIGATNTATAVSLATAIDPQISGLGYTVTVLYDQFSGIYSISSDNIPTSSLPNFTLATNDPANFNVVAAYVTVPFPYRQEAGFTPIVTNDANQDYVAQPRGDGALVMAIRTNTLDLLERGIGAVDLQAPGAKSSKEFVAFGNYSAIIGGKDGLADGESAVVLGGETNEAGGERAAVLGGKLNNASGQESVVAGVAGGSHFVTNRHVISNSNSDTVIPVGDRQVSRYVLSSAEQNTGRMSTNGDDVTNANNFPTLLFMEALYPATGGYNPLCHAIAHVTAQDTVGNLHVWELKGVIQVLPDGTGAGTMTLVSSTKTTVISVGAPAATWDCDFLLSQPGSAPGSRAFTILVDGDTNANNMNWVAHVTVTENTIRT